MFRQRDVPPPTAAPPHTTRHPLRGTKASSPRASTIERLTGAQPLPKLKNVGCRYALAAAGSKRLSFSSGWTAAILAVARPRSTRPLCAGVEIARVCAGPSRHPARAGCRRACARPRVARARRPPTAASPATRSCRDLLREPDHAWPRRRWPPPAPGAVLVYRRRCATAGGCTSVPRTTRRSCRSPVG